MEGIVYYNIGLKCLARLAVSVSTAIRHCPHEITILSDGDECHQKCWQIATQLGVHVKYIRSDDFVGKNYAMLNKCRLHRITPYKKTLFVDCDTIILQNFTECFKLLDEYEFIVPQFCNWISTDRHYRRRIENWRGHIGDDIMATAFNEKRAVNVGFYGWREGASIFNEWFSTAIKNRTSFIPDEVACQILLGRHNHHILDSSYNTSCKHEALTDKTRTLHYHGRKHCRIDNGQYIYHSDLWYAEFDKIRHFPCVYENIEHDRMLRIYLQEHDKIRASRNG